MGPRQARAPTALERRHDPRHQNPRTPVQLDQILTSLQSAPDRATCRSCSRSTRPRCSRRGRPGYDASIPYWEPAYKNTALVNQSTFSLLPGDLNGFHPRLRHGRRRARRQPAAAADLITDFNRTAAAFSRNQSALEQTIAELPRTLRAAGPALDALNASFPAVRALAAALRPAVKSTGPTIDASLPFITQARNLVSTPELRGLVATSSRPSRRSASWTA